MKPKILLLLTALLVFCNNPAEAQAGFVDGVELTAIQAPWKMRIAGNDLDITGVQAKPDSQSAYFMMTSGSSQLNVSVFIEPADKCKTADECRDHVLALGNPGWGKFEALAKSRIKEFSYFEFFRPEVRGKPVKMLDMYAQYVGQGYWVDVHISKALYKKEDHALFEKVINSISFVPNSGPQNTPFDLEIASGAKASAAWLDLWDKSKCRESYLGLSSITRAENTEGSWVEYCNKVNTGLGANSSRKLIAAAFTRSLLPKTDRPLAILAYHSNFQNRASVVEIVGLLLEPNASWSVTNYFPK